MGFFDRVKQSASGAGNAAKRQARKARLQMKGVRIERRIRGQKTAIGEAVYPKLKSGELEVRSADVTVAMSAIGELEEELKANKEALAALDASGGGADKAETAE